MFRQVSLLCLWVAIVSNLYIHSVQTRWEHGENTRDVCCCPLHGDTFLVAHKHNTVVVWASEVQTLDGEDFVSLLHKRRL